MYEQSLSQAGLYAEQAQIYELLLKNGSLKAGKIAQKTEITRSLVYRILEELISMNLVEKDENSEKVAKFSPKHPMELQNLAEKKERQAKNAQIALETIMPSLASEFNLLQDIPDIRFYEGKEGIKKVADDSLSATSEILSYTDNEAMNKYYPEFNKSYVQKRLKLSLKKRMITIDCDFIRARANKYDPNLTEIRLIDGEQYPFATVMQIYDNKISYTTLDEKKLIGVIIEDEYIAKMHKSLFEFTWAKSKPLIKKEETNK